MQLREKKLKNRRHVALRTNHDTAAVLLKKEWGALSQFTYKAQHRRLFFRCAEAIDEAGCFPLMGLLSISITINGEMGFSEVNAQILGSSLIFPEMVSAKPTHVPNLGPVILETAAIL